MMSAMVINSRLKHKAPKAILGSGSHCGGDTGVDDHLDGDHQWLFLGECSLLSVVDAAMIEMWLQLTHGRGQCISLISKAVLSFEK